MICYLFPGQGSQSLGMGKGLFERYPDKVAAADDILGWSIEDLCLRDPERRLNNTRYTQPAIYVVNALACLERWRNAEDEPAYLAGHSLGEYNALQAAGVFSFEDGLKLVKKRGELMAAAGQGGMAAVLKMPPEEIRRFLDENGCGGIDIANVNGPAQIVVSGPRDEIDRAQSVFDRAGVDFIPLNTSGAFHSRYMQPARAEYAEFLRGFEFAAPRMPVISNLHAAPYPAAEIAPLLADQLTHPVKWRQSMEYLLERGVETFEELGNGEVLSKMLGYIREDVAGRRGAVSSGSADDESPRRRIDDWNRLHAAGTPVRVAGSGDTRRTRSEAMLLQARKAVIYLEGYRGWFPLRDVSAES